MNVKYMTMLLLAAIILSGCTGREEADARTIQQIQEEDGIPVTIQVMEYQPFIINYNYSANLSGINETTVTSSIADRVEEVLVKVGDYVEKDQVLLTFPEDNPMGQYRQAKAIYENSLANYERMKSLYKTGGISQSNLDQLETGLTINRANYEAADQTIRIKAPFAGYVTKLFVRKTESVGMGADLATITVLDKYKARVWVTEDELQDIRTNSSAVALVSGNTLPGKVVQTSQSMDMNRQAFIVDVEFDNPKRLNISGVLASINITAYRKENAIVISRQHIHNPGQQNSYVYVVEDDKAIRKDVTSGRNDGLQFEVIKGLAEGDKLITQGTNSVAEESLIRIIHN